MRTLMIKAVAKRALMFAALAALVFQTAGGQSNNPKASAGEKNRNTWSRGRRH